MRRDADSALRIDGIRDLPDALGPEDAMHLAKLVLAYIHAAQQGGDLEDHEWGVVIKDPQEVSERALRMAKEGMVIAVDGTKVPLDAQTLCVHGDNPSAVDLVKGIRKNLEADEVSVIPMGKE